MHAILLATGFVREMEPLLHYRPTPILNVADKPILFHILEFLSHHGCRTFDIILSHLPETIEERVAKGQRWGITVRYHLAQVSEFPFKPLQIAAHDIPEKRVLIGSADCLPLLKMDQIREEMQEDKNILYYLPSYEWAGWGIVQTEDLRCLSSDTTMHEFPGKLKSGYKTKDVLPLLSTRSYEDLMESNRVFLQQKGRMHFFPSSARCVEKGIWISRGVILKPSVKVHPPVFIGEFSKIESGALIGPNAVIENHCIIDKRAVVENSIIFQNSYVGEQIQLRNSIVDRNLLVNMTFKSDTMIVDNFILSDIAPPSMFDVLLFYLMRVITGFFLLLLAPIYLLLKRKNELKTKYMVKLPAPYDSFHWDSFSWQTFFPKKGHIQTGFEQYFRRIPLLFTVLKGDLHFVGVAPRTLEEMEQLPTDWKKLYSKSKVGLITLSDLDYGEYPTDDERYASESYYAAHMSAHYDLQLFSRWIYRKLARGGKGFILKIREILYK